MFIFSRRTDFRKLPGNQISFSKKKMKKKNRFYFEESDTSMNDRATGFTLGMPMMELDMLESHASQATPRPLHGPSKDQGTVFWM